MKIKKSILLFVVFLLCASISLGSFGAYGAEKITGDVLYNLGIFPEKTDNIQREITRAEAARYVVGLLGVGNCEQTDTFFADVTKDHMLSGYVATALERGIVSKAENYRPDDKIIGSEFVKMIIGALGYDSIAQAKGGYPSGYIFTAQMLGVLDGANLSEGECVTVDKAITVLSNALNSPVLSGIITENEDGNLSYAYENAKKTETYLYKKLGIRVYNVYVEDIRKKDNVATVTILSEKSYTESSDYKKGLTYKLKIAKDTEYNNIAHANASVWINEDDEIIYFKLDEDTQIKYAYIDEINKVHNLDGYFEVREIENIALVGEEDYIDVAENCKFYFDGEKIDAGAKQFVGSFAKVVIKDDEVLSVEAFKMNDGGIVTNVDNGVITYKNGKWDDKEFKSHSGCDDVEVIVNGQVASYWGIVPEMLFNYYESEEKCILVVSSRSVTDSFDAKSPKSAILGGDEYYFSEKFPVYFSEDGISYTKNLTADDLVGELVTAHLDWSGEIRYMSIPVYNEENSEFYGFVLGYEEDLFADDVKFKICRLYDDRTEERILTVTKTVKNTPEYEVMKNAAKALYEGESFKEELKNSNDIVWKIRAVGGKIISLKEADLFDQNPENGITNVTYIPGGTVPYISSPRVYFDGAVICALYYDDYLGEVTARILNHSEIRDKTFSNVRIDFYNKSNSSDIELMLMRGDVKSIATNRADLINIGVMKFLTYTKGKEDKMAADVKILGDATYKVPAESIDGNSTYYYVKYAKNAAIADESPINIVETVSLDGSPYSWKVNDCTNSDGSINIADGLYTDVVTRSDGRRIFFETQDPKQNDPISKDVRYYLDVLSDYHIYQITDNPENRFEEVTINEVEPGMRVWYGLRNSTIAFVIIK